MGDLDIFVPLTTVLRAFPQIGVGTTVAVLKGDDVRKTKPNKPRYHLADATAKMRRYVDGMAELEQARGREREARREVLRKIRALTELGPMRVKKRPDPKRREVASPAA